MSLKSRTRSESLRQHSFVRKHRTLLNAGGFDVRFLRKPPFVLPQHVREAFFQMRGFRSGHIVAGRSVSDTTESIMTLNTPETITALFLKIPHNVITRKLCMSDFGTPVDAGCFT